MEKSVFEPLNLFYDFIEKIMSSQKVGEAVINQADALEHGPSVFLFVQQSQFSGARALGTVTPLKYIVFIH